MADTADDATAPREASRYASRKFLVAVVLLVINVVVLGVGWIDSAQYVDFAKWITGLYYGANVATWVTDLLKGRVP
jgi:hypothetical protein